MPKDSVSRRTVGAPRLESATTRALILDAAERRFAERGFAGVSVREIAAEVGLKNQASLYNHFQNKRALYEAVLTRGVGPILDLVAESGKAAPGGDITVVIGAGTFLDRVFDYLAEHPHLPRLIQRAALDDSKYFRSVAIRVLRPVYSQGLEVLSGGGEVWNRSELPNLAAGLYHLIFGYFANAELLEAVVQRDLLSPAAVAQQRRFLKAAVRRLVGVEARLPRGEKRRQTKKEKLIHETG